MTATRAAVYVRLSVDKTGTSAGVDRQEAACRELCAARGYEVAAVLGGKDGSAVRDPRPGFADLVRLASNAEVDTIVAWSHDRLSRSMTDTTALLACGVPIVTVQGGTTEASAEGTLRAQIATAVAQFETARKRERMHEAYAQKRAAGIPHPGTKLPGLERDHRHAGMIAAGWRRVLAGESLSAVARDWSAAGVRTATGREPTPWDVHRWLIAERYAGRLPDGTPGTGPALVDGHTFDAVKALFADRTRAPRPGGRIRWALPAVGVCGRCRLPVRSCNAGKAKRHAYRCPTTHLVRDGAVPDRFVLAVAAERLSRPDAVELLSTDVAPLVRERDAVKGRWDALADLAADGTLDADAVRRRAAPLRARVEALTGQIAASASGPDLADVPGAGAGARLAALVPRRLAEVYQLLFAAVVLEPPPRKGYRFTDDEPGVTVEWRQP